MKNRLIRGFALAAVLTASLGRIHNADTNMTETWYDLPMDNVIAHADSLIGIPDMYHIDDRGVKMYGTWVIVAAHPSRTRFTRIETSLGEGIILDYHTVDDPELIDIATDWKD